MTDYLKCTGLLSILFMLSSPTVLAQPGEKTEPTDADASSSQEVEVTEDNYRQFMELKDPRQRRAILPEDAFKPKTGSQKIDKLPEESQKHLRNQLREIIVQGDQWQPGDENQSYPYVPSEAAVADRQLQKQEAEAWGELVDNYHRREAEIFENSARSEAAMAAEGSSAGGSNTGSGSPGDGTGQPGETQQESQQSQANQASAADSYSPSARKDPNATGTSGVSQNAMEYLQRMAQREGDGNGAAPAPGPGNDKQGMSQQPTGQEAATGQNTPGREAGAHPSKATENQSMAGASQNAMEFLQGQSGEAQAGTGPGENTDSPVGDSVQGDAQEQADQQAFAAQYAATATSTSSDSESDSVAGTSQNAMEFLQQGASQGEGTSSSQADSSLADNGQDGEGDKVQDPGQENGEQQADASDSPALTAAESGEGEEGESTTGVSQNALEFVTGAGRQPSRGQEPVMPPGNTAPAGTLNIQDLINAKGVGSSNAPPPIKNPEPEPDIPPPEKDGGG